MTTPALAPEVERQVVALGPRDLAVALLTYNSAATVPGLATVVRAALARDFAGVPAALINADAGSSDGTSEALAGAGLPVVLARHDAPLAERASVPFHGVPGRAAALRLVVEIARRLQARVLVLLEADVTSVTGEWIERLARPVWEDKADLVLGVNARHRYDGTITNLLLAPMVRALFGRRVRQPLGGAQALSARLFDLALGDPRWPAAGRESAGLWLLGTAFAADVAVREAWLGPRRVESSTRTADLPGMLAQSLGGLIAVMERCGDLWLGVRGSEPLPVAGEPPPPPIEERAVDVERMLDAFRRGLRDLLPIWEHVLAPETLGDVLGLDAREAARFAFPDDLWARVVYDFALGHRYHVVHRDHLLRSLVPLYLGRTAAFVLATRGRGADADAALLDAVGAAFERQKPYLTDHWR